jgi:hypothetical protein
MVGDAGTGNFRPEDTIIRSEAAKITVHALGLEEMAEAAAGSTNFPDVVEGHWATGYINIAASHGIVIGDDVGTFRPDDTITFAEIVTMLVRITGHEHTAMQRGGYPNGYIITSTQNGISKNVNAQANEPVTRGTVAQLAFNSLTVKLMEQTGFGSESEYSVVDKTLLSDTLNVYSGVGIITANENVSLTEAETTRAGEVMINGNIYRIGNTDAKNLIGYNVTYYYTKNSNGNNETLILAHPEAEQNEALAIKAEDIENVSSNNGIAIEYRTDESNYDRIETANISGNANIIFNGKKAEVTGDDFDIESGEIMLIDNNKDGEYDLAIIKSYENYVVNNVSISNNKINDKYGKPSITLNPKSSEYNFSIIKDGREIEIKDLKEWDVLAVGRSKDNDLINIIVVAQGITGKVSELSNDEVNINGTFYKVAANYPNAISLNDNGTFYLDIDGKIAAASTNASISSNNYAYLAAVEAGLSLDSEIQIKLLTSSGNVANYAGAEKIILNGVSKDAGAVALELQTNGKTNKQLITYELNTNDKVSKINTATDATSTGYNKNEFSMDSARPTSEENYLLYKTASGRLGETYVLKSNTIVFDVSDEDNYTVRNKSIFVDNNKYDAVVYEATETFTANIVVLYSKEATVNPEASIAVVDRITTAISNDGSEVNVLYALENGEAMNKPAANEGVLLKANGTENVALQRGDIVQYSINAKGEIDKVSVLFDVNNNEHGINNDGYLTTINGIIENKIDETITINNGNGNISPYNITDAIVYKYNSQNNTVSTCEFDETEIEDNVFMRIYKDEVKEVVIIG